MQEVFEKIIDQLKAESIIVDDEAGNRTVEIIKQVATEYNNGWIPVEERLPEPFDNVLISTEEGSRAIGHRCPNQARGRYYDLHSSTIDNVIAWQPLPEPYQPKGECKHKKQTNADRIHSMSVEELADMFTRIVGDGEARSALVCEDYCGGCAFSCKRNRMCESYEGVEAYDAIMDYLQSEVEG